MTKNPKDGEPNIGDKIIFIKKCDTRFNPGDIATVQSFEGTGAFALIYLIDDSGGTATRSHGNIMISNNYAKIYIPKPMLRARSRFELIED